MDPSGSPRWLVASYPWQASWQNPSSQVCQPGKPTPESKKPPTQPPSASRQSVPPKQLRAAAGARIQRIQASLGALQPEDTEERRVVLQSALEKVQAQVPPSEKQILATDEFLARSRKRLLNHDATIAAAREALRIAEHDKEVDV